MREAKNLNKTAVAIFQVLIAFSAYSQQQPTAAPGYDESATGRINGRVVNESGQPLLGATVYVRAVGSTTQARATVTDSEGNFKVSNLDPIVYRVSARFQLIRQYREARMQRLITTAPATRSDWS